MDLATVPSAADADRAAQIIPGRICTVGRWSDPDGMSFNFLTKDGEWLSYFGSELRTSTWWYWLSEADVYDIASTLFPEDEGAQVFYVARYAPGYRLIPGTRMSRIFSGEGAREAVDSECTRLRAHWPNAGVFRAHSVEAAERLASSAAPEQERIALQNERMAATRAMLLARLQGAEARHA